MRGHPDTPENRLAMLRRLDRPDGVLHVHEREESPLIAGMVRDGLLVPVLFTKTATDYAIGEKGRATGIEPVYMDGALTRARPRGTSPANGSLRGGG